MKCPCGSTKRAYYGFVYKKPITCSICRIKGMVDVVSKRCLHDSCTVTHPSFNYKGEKQGLYCSEHSLPCMVDVMHTKCLLCDTQSIFNYISEKKVFIVKNTLL